MSVVQRDAEAQVLAGAHPCCKLKLSSGIARIPEMLARGISVALGSDGAPSNNNLDLFQSSSVQTSIIGGRVVMENRELLTMDETEVIDGARTALKTLRGPR